MNAYQLRFTDGSVGYCEGQSEMDAKTIAEHVTGKSVAPKDGVDEPRSWAVKDDYKIKPLPYPCSGMIWQFDHPKHGKTPGFCHQPAACAGKGSCPNPRGRSCTS